MLSGSQIILGPEPTTLMRGSLERAPLRTRYPKRKEAAMFLMMLPWPQDLALTMENTTRNTGTSSTALASFRDLTR